MQDLFFADDKGCRLPDLNTRPITMIVTKEKNLHSLLRTVDWEVTQRSDACQYYQRANITPAAKPVVVC